MKNDFVPSDKDRLTEFFKYCDRLENHPFFQLMSKTRESVSLHFKAGIGFTGERHFDPIHLESFLNLLRQLYGVRDLFNLGELRRSAIAVFGTSGEFEKAYQKQVINLNCKYKSIFGLSGPSGQDVVDGKTFLQLLELKMYHGPLHSERLLKAVPGTVEADMVDPHVWVSARLDDALAYTSMNIAASIFVFRTDMLRLAVEYGKDHEFPHLLVQKEKLKKYL